MNILLVKPNLSVDQVTPSLGLGYLASMLTPSHDVHVLDCQKEGYSIFDFEKYIADLRPQCVGIQCFSYGLRLVKEYLKAVKNVDDRIMTILGGPHPTVAPEHTLSFFEGNMSYALRGEAEESIVLLMNEMEKVYPSKNRAPSEKMYAIPGLIWEDSKGMHSSPSAIIENINSLKMPRWDLLKPETYPYAPMGGFFKQFPIAPLSLSRGCPYDCIYCSSGKISGNKLRYRDIGNIINEILYLYNNLGIKEFHFIDDNFTLSREFVMKYCQRIIELGLDISWACPNGVRVDTLDEEIVEKMKEAGCYSLSFGIESGSQRILDFIKKRTTLDNARKAIDLVTKKGIEANGFFILGFPTETVDEMKETIRFSLELDLTRANYFPYRPLPGTEAYEFLKNNEGLQNISIDAHSLADPVYAPRGLTTRKLKKIQRWAFMRFYLRPRTFWRLLRRIHSFKHLKYVLERGKRWLW